jgi:hypothetical protein
VFGFAVNLEDPTPEQIRQLTDTLDGFRPRPMGVEILTLHLIAGLDPKQLRRWPAGTIRRLLLTAQEAKQAVVMDGRCLPWVRDELARADLLRREAIRALCDPQASDDAIREALSKLDRARAGYAAQGEAANALGKAWHEYEETCAVLADLATAFPDDLNPIPESAASNWTALADEFRRLQGLLVATEHKLPSPDELARVTQGVRTCRLRMLPAMRSADEAGFKVIENALTWLWWTPGERAALLARHDRNSREVTDRVLAKWPTSRGSKVAQPPRRSSTIAKESVRDLRRLADLVGLAENPAGPLAKADTAAAKALPFEPEAGKLGDLSRRVREGWRLRLPELYRTGNPSRRAEIGWAVEPDDIPAIARPGLLWPPNPELIERRVREREFHSWLADSWYKPEAVSIRELNLKEKEPRAYAEGLETVARDYLEWSP